MRRKIIVAVSSVGLVLAIATVVLQLISGPVFYFEPLPVLAECTENDSLLVYRLRRSLDGIKVTGTMGDAAVAFELTTNSIGLRSPEVSPEKDCYRILVLGDSCTFGLGVDNKDTYPACLERLLNAGHGQERRFEVINAGVAGYTAWQCARYLEVRGLKLDPDLVITCLGNNDVPEPNAPNAVNHLPRVYSGSYVQELLLDLAVYRIALAAYVWLLDGWDSPGQRQSGLAHASPAQEAYRDNLLKIARTCKETSTPLMFMVWPLLVQLPEQHDGAGTARARHYFRSRIDNQRVMDGVAKSEGVPLVDPRAALAVAREGPLYLEYIHANEKGLAIIAGVLKRAVLEHLGATRRPPGR